MLMVVRLAHPSKPEVLIPVSPSLSVTVVRFVQPAKTNVSMLFTEVGTVTLVIVVLSMNA